MSRTVAPARLARIVGAHVAALSCLVGAGLIGAETTHADWNEEYTSNDPVDASGFVDVVGSADGGAFVLGFHSGDFEGVSAGLRYQPFVQFRDADGDVAWTERLLGGESCTDRTPSSTARGLDDAGIAVFAFETCTGQHLVTATVSGVLATRSFPVPDDVVDPDETEAAAKTFLLAAADPTGGVYVVTAEQRIVDSGSSDLFLTSYDADLVQTTTLSLAAEFPEGAEGNVLPDDLVVDSSGVAFLIGRTPAPLAHLDDDERLVRVQPGGGPVSSTSLGSAECVDTDILRVTKDEIWIVDCTEVADPEYGDLRVRARVDVYARADPARRIARHPFPDTDGGALENLFLYGLPRLSADGTLAAGGGYGWAGYTRITGPDPAAWSQVRVGQPDPSIGGRSTLGFDVLGDDLIEVGVVGASAFFSDRIAGAGVAEVVQVSQLVTPPHAFIERTTLPTLVGRTPVRFVDTRQSGETVDGEWAGTGRLAAGSVTQIDIAGRGAVADDAVAVFVNLTAVAPSANGYLSAFPCDADVPTTSALNYRSGVNSGNHVLAVLDPDGELCVYTSASTHLVADVGSYHDAGGELGTLPPARLLDTRPGGETVDGRATGVGTRPPDVDIVVPVAGRGGVPEDARHVYVNISAINPIANGFGVASPCGGPVSTTSAINFAAYQVVNNLALVELGDDGAICLRTSWRAELTVDVVAWLGDASSLDTSVATRVLETRAYTGVDPSELPPGLPPEELDCCRMGPGETQAFSAQDPVTGEPVRVVFVNVAAVAPSSDGFISVFSCEFGIEESGRAPTAAVNFTAGVTTANTAMLATGPSGEVCVTTSARTHLVVDLIAVG